MNEKKLKNNFYFTFLSQKYIFCMCEEKMFRHDEWLKRKMSLLSAVILY